MQQKVQTSASEELPLSAMDKPPPLDYGRLLWTVFFSIVLHLSLGLLALLSFQTFRGVMARLMRLRRIRFQVKIMSKLLGSNQCMTAMPTICLGKCSFPG